MTSSDAPDTDPHGISLARYAELSAEIAEGLPLADVLRAAGLNEKQWTEVSVHWLTRMGEDAMEHGADATLADTYSAAFAAAQDGLTAPRELSPEEYAELVVSVMQHGSVEQPLAARQWSKADYMRICRTMAKRLSSDPHQQERFFERFRSLQPRGEGP